MSAIQVKSPPIQQVSGTKALEVAPDSAGANVARRGPYRARVGKATPQGEQRPSDVLARNIRSYRMLRDMTQDQLASEMTALGHGWTRSAVSATEGNGRNVTIDEVFGLAICFGVVIGTLLDPSGPDRSQAGVLDVGLSLAGHPGPLPPRLSSHLAMSRASLRIAEGDGGTLELNVVDVSAEPE